MVGVSAALTPDKGYEPILLFFGVLILWAGLATAVVWQLVGTWRSADRYVAERRVKGQGGAWGRVAQLMLILAALQSLGSFGTNARLQIVETYRIAFMDDPDIPANKITVLDGGTRIHLEGGIKYGLAREIAAVLRAAPQATVLSRSRSCGQSA